MKRAEYQVEPRKIARVEVSLAARREIHLDRVKDAKAPASELRVQVPNLLSLARELRLVHPVCDRKPLRVVGYREILESSLHRRVRHLADGCRTVASNRVRLEISAHLVRRGPALQNPVDIRSAEEGSTCVRGLRHGGRIEEPLPNEVREPRPDEAELGQGVAFAEELTGFDGPAKGGPSGASKGALLLVASARLFGGPTGQPGE